MPEVIAAIIGAASSALLFALANILDFLGQAWFWIVVAAASELIALNPKLKSNSVIQLAMKALDSAKPSKKKFDK
jgi:hypothetical protein